MKVQGLCVAPPLAGWLTATYYLVTDDLEHEGTSDLLGALPSIAHHCRVILARKKLPTQRQQGLRSS